MNLSDHFLSSISEGGNGLYDSRASLGELYPPGEFSVINQEHTD